MFSAGKKPLSMPMKTGHRLADGEPTVPIVTVSTARAGVTSIHAPTMKASPVRADVLMSGMMLPPLSVCAPHDRQARLRSNSIQTEPLPMRPLRDPDCGFFDHLLAVIRWE